MRQRDEARRVVRKGLDGFRHAAARGLAEEVALRVLADEQGQRDVRHLRQQAVVPQRRALLARWQVTALATAWVAIAHGHDRDARRVVEHLAVDAEPAAQLVAALVVPRHAGLVHREARRLADDQQPCARTGLHDRARPERQVGLACAAGADVGEQRVHGAEN